MDETSSNDHEEWSGSLPAEEATTIDGISIGAVSTEGGGEEEAAITPTAPPMTPGEISGQQELVGVVVACYFVVVISDLCL